jgi:hypothetical protein
MNAQQLSHDAYNILHEARYANRMNYIKYEVTLNIIIRDAAYIASDVCDMVQFHNKYTL